MKLLLSAGATTEIHDDFDVSYCLVKSPFEASRLLLDRGLDLTKLVYKNQQGDLICDGFNNVLSELLCEDNYEKIQLLRPFGIMVFLNAFESDLGRSPLCQMAEEENLKGLLWLIQEGADVNAYCEATIGPTAIELAVDTGSIQIVQALLDAGANPNIPTWMWKTPVDRVVNYSTTPRKHKHDPENKPDRVEIRKLILEAAKRFPPPIYPDGSMPSVWPPLSNCR